MNTESDDTRNSTDAYFTKMPDVLKSYSFDYEALFDYKSEVEWSNLLGFPIAYPCYYACGKPNIRDECYARHIALTADGVRYIVDRHPKECRLQCQEVGRISTTVPYDKITDCDVLEPAGAEGCPCALVSRTMYTFTVSTASANPALEIWGIHAPYELKRDVWNMKRGQGIEGCAGSAVAPLGVSMDREAEGKEAGPSGSYDYRGGGGSMGGEACTRLLGEILATLREQNAILLRKS